MMFFIPVISVLSNCTLSQAKVVVNSSLDLRPGQQSDPFFFVLLSTACIIFHHIFIDFISDITYDHYPGHTVLHMFNNNHCMYHCLHWITTKY